MATPDITDYEIATLRGVKEFVAEQDTPRPPTVGDLGDYSDRSSSVFSVGSDRLEAKGWVTKTTPKDNKRVTVIRLTDDGKRALTLLNELRTLDETQD